MREKQELGETSKKQMIDGNRREGRDDTATSARGDRLD